MANPLRKLAARLPVAWQQSLKRRHFSRQINRDSFVTGEPEFWRLAEWLKPGDWAIDVGANIGHYTLGMSKVVGPQGRVLALEPIPETFELLAGNCALSPHQNITLLNAAASSGNGLVGMAVPIEATGRNYYEAAIQESVNGDGYHVLGVALDSLPIPHRVSLVKIDAEGHEPSVIEGMKGLLARDKPVIIAEWLRDHEHLKTLGYVSEKAARSPNFVWRPVA